MLAITLIIRLTLLYGRTYLTKRSFNNYAIIIISILPSICRHTIIPALHAWILVKEK